MIMIVYIGFIQRRRSLINEAFLSEFFNFCRKTQSWLPRETKCWKQPWRWISDKCVISLESIYLSDLVNKSSLTFVGERKSCFFGKIRRFRYEKKQIRKRTPLRAFIRASPSLSRWNIPQGTPIHQWIGISDSLVSYSQSNTCPSICWTRCIVGNNFRWRKSLFRGWT